MGPWVIEFRSGSFYVNEDRDHGGSLEEAMRFLNKTHAERYMARHSWVLHNGGMPVYRPRKPATLPHR